MIYAFTLIYYKILHFFTLDLISRYMNLVNFRQIFLFFTLIVISFSLEAQETYTYGDLLKFRSKIKGDIVRLQVDGLDTNYVVKMRPIIVFPERKFKSLDEKMRYNRMVYNVKKVYPYSQIIKRIFIETEYALRKIDSKRDRRKYIKRKEKQLTAEFEKDVRSMTYSQGRILIRLIDRETGHTGYEIIQHFKGKFTAMFWQAIAKLFSSDLKYEYDKDGEERWIEEIVAKIENGQL